MNTLTWYGNATVKLQVGSTSLVFDPFITMNPGLPRLSARDLGAVTALALTHGHFDHARDVGAFSEQLGVPILLPEPVAQNLVKFQGISPQCLSICPFHQKIQMGELTLTMLHSRHVRFDPRLILQTLPRVLRFPRKAIGMVAEHFPLGACVAWQVEFEGRSLLHLGSMAFDPSEHYPQGIDVLSIPLQGNSKIYSIALAAVDRLQPKAVFFHHFDNAFPPLTSTIAIEPMAVLLHLKYPDLRVIAPQYGVAVEL
jgi:L-ascorbate metabolism protein UlaG (beta-lactamase superfamily)